ncbi:MAG: N-6 DNA methylase, partial [Chloroflexota bacterium]|nr:N-6 DNA methylase [Chloroflexota bacterium]
MTTNPTFKTYLQTLKKTLATGDATEHSHRGALGTLLETLDESLSVVNEPKRIACGAPDYIILRAQTPIGYIEAKDIGADLHTAEGSEQLDRYRTSLNNLILSDYLEFRWYVDGELRETTRLGKLGRDGKIRSEKEGTEKVANLLERFLAQSGAVIGDPEELARRMAALARMLRDVLEEALLQEQDSGVLHTQLQAFQETLIPDLDVDQFADMYAQTITYGLFAARVRVPAGETFTRRKAAWNLPKTNPFLRKLFNEIAGPDLDERIAWLVDDLADLLSRTDMPAILRDFGAATRQEDPVVHFYETFLSAYDPAMRQARGVYYTPEPVVSYIVRSLDHLLKTRFDKPDGLADRDTLILDPAVGTATFLYFVIRHVYESLDEMGMAGMWDDYAENQLLPRLFGFELLMAPYAVAHMKLGIQLQELGFKFQGNQRLGVYLTNTLGKPIFQEEAAPFARYITEEANAAAQVKEDEPIMIVLGNPPYSVSSSNKGEYIEKLMKRYKKAVRDERNIQPLSDDYIKFLRFAHHRINQTGHGMIGMITNHSYLSGLIHRGMREELLKDFDELYLLNLHGNALMGETDPDGGKDENVFDIRQGVAIILAVKLPSDESQSQPSPYPQTSPHPLTPSPQAGRGDSRAPTAIAT